MKFIGDIDEDLCKQKCFRYQRIPIIEKFNSNLTMLCKNPKYGLNPATNYLQSITTVQLLQINYNRIWINRIWPGWFGLQPDKTRIPIRSADFRKFRPLMWNKIDLLINSIHGYFCVPKWPETTPKYLSQLKELGFPVWFHLE